MSANNLDINLDVNQGDAAPTLCGGNKRIIVFTENKTLLLNEGNYSVIFSIILA